MNKITIAVTGANGFIGSYLSDYLVANQFIVKRVVRSFVTSHNEIPIGDIGPLTSWSFALKGVSVIIHTAAYLHNYQIDESKDGDNYYSVNYLGTLNLAMQAAECKVRRIIFLSSVKVNGDDSTMSFNKNSFSYIDQPQPRGNYAISKWDAERALWHISRKTGIEIVVIRVPFVYGYGAKGNFDRLVNLIKLNIPLPFKSINNKRSMIGIDNLLSLLKECVIHPEAPGNTFMASDDSDISTIELVNIIAKNLNLSIRIFNFPIFLLKFLGILFRRSTDIDRLIKSQKVDIIHTKNILGWSPQVTVEEGIRKAVYKYC